MKIFGRFGWFWYREMFKITEIKISATQALKRRMFLLKLHEQLRSDEYGNRIISSCEMELARLSLINEYLHIRKQKQKENKTWHELI